MLKFTVNGNFDKITRSLKRKSNINYRKMLDRYGREGVRLLSAATPSESGKTAASWGYVVSGNRKSWQLTWTNSNTTDSGTPIAILIQHGHATGNGAFVKGVDFINPALSDLKARLQAEIAREITG